MSTRSPVVAVILALAAIVAGGAWAYLFVEGMNVAANAGI
jgi:hypothetical protein